MKYITLIIVLGSCCFSYGQTITFEEIPTIPDSLMDYSEAVFGDIDGDNDLDLLVSGENYANDSEVMFFENDGNGSFTTMNVSPILGIEVGAYAFADVDGDGDLDLFETGTHTDDLGSFYSSILYENDGNGNFTILDNTTFPHLAFSSVEFADIDNDGDQDLFIMGRDPLQDSRTELYKNDGMGNFTYQTFFNHLVILGAFGLSDFDGDTDLDLLLSGYDSNTSDPVCVQYMNDGNGNYFLEPSNFEPFKCISQHGFSFGDKDGDGDLDVLTSGSSTFNGPLNIIYVNDGNGVFTAEFPNQVSPTVGGSGIFTDLSGDGIADYYATGNEDIGGTLDYESYMYVNDGLGTLTSVPHVIEPVAGEIAKGDIDNDGDIDIFVMGYANGLGDKAYLYRNLSPVSVEEIDADQFISVYPNPSNDYLQVDVDYESEFSVTLINNKGEQVFKGENVSKIKVSSLSSGIYLLRIKIGNGMKVTKVTIE